MLRNSGVLPWLVLACAALAPAQRQPSYLITTIAGNGRATYAGDGQAAKNLLLYTPQGLAVDQSGTLYFSDTYYNRVFKVTAGGVVTVAGTGEFGSGGDGGSAAAAQLNGPVGLAFDTAGNLYIADTGNSRIRKVTTNGTITLVAGTQAGYGGDSGPAKSAKLNGPTGVAVDASGNVYIADQQNHRVRKVSMDGTITTIAGTGVPGFSGEGGPPTSAMLQMPFGVAVNAAGNVYISDRDNNRIRKIGTDGTLVTVVGSGDTAWSSDMSGSGSRMAHPEGIALDSQGNLWIADALNQRLRELPPTGILTTVAGSGQTGADGQIGDDGLAKSAPLFGPRGVAVDPSSGNVYVSEMYGRRIRKIDPGQLTISRAVGTDPNLSAVGDGPNALAAALFSPSGVAVDVHGNYWIADQRNNRVRNVNAAGAISTVAGNGQPGNTGDRQSGTLAQVLLPSGVTLSPNGSNMYFASAAQVVRMVNGAGQISTWAGNATAGFSGDGGQATSAQLFTPSGMAFDPQDITVPLYLADRDNNRIRKSPTVGTGSAGLISTFAGTGAPGYADNAQAAQAQFFHPQAVAADSAGNLYVADTGNRRVRKISGGAVTTIAGNGDPGVAGDGGPAASAALDAPTGIAVDGAGNVYVSAGALIRKISPAGVITTIAGTGTPGYSGDGGPATSAQLNAPAGLAIDRAGNVYVADQENHRIRLLQPVQIFQEGVLNAASYKGGAVAPGEIVTIYGAGIGPDTPATLNVTAGRLDTMIGATRVLFDGVPAPMIFTSAGQVSAIVPYAVAGKTQTQLQIEYQGQKTNSVTLPVAATAPALFSSDGTGKGQGAIYNQDYTLNSRAAPAAAGSIVMLFGTGEGQTNPPGQDGLVATATYPKPVQPVTVQIGGVTAEVLYYGAAPSLMAGMLQVNARIPAGLTPGDAAVSITAGGVTSQAGVTVAVK